MWFRIGFVLFETWKDKDQLEIFVYPASYQSYKWFKRVSQKSKDNNQKSIGFVNKRKETYNGNAFYEWRLRYKVYFEPKGVLQWLYSKNWQILHILVIP